MLQMFARSAVTTATMRQALLWVACSVLPTEPDLCGLHLQIGWLQRPVQGRDAQAALPRVPETVPEL